MKVYIVTQGDYSAYHIEAVFLTYEQAVAYMERHIAQSEWVYGMQIEEYEMDAEAPKSDKLMWEVEYKKNLWSIKQTNVMTDTEPELNSVRWFDDVFPWDEFSMFTFAKDKWQALKIGQDTYAKMKAEREGL